MVTGKYGPLTLGHLREISKDLPDDTPFCPDWQDFEPADSDPAVVLKGLGVSKSHDGVTYISVGVAVCSLDELSGEEED